MTILSENKNITYYRTAGGSMFPLIRWGDGLIVKKTSGDSLQRGDIIVFREDNEHPVCHRITRIENKNGKRCFYTKGDLNDEEDVPVPEEKIIGRVIAIRKGRRIITCQSPKWSPSYSRHTYLLSRSIFTLKNKVKRMIDSIRTSRLRRTR